MGARAGLILRPCCSGANPYLKVNLSIENRVRQGVVHRLVCEAFHGPPPTDKHTVNHKNGKKLDNDDSNLEWMTRSENMRHALATGLLVARKGSEVSGAVLTENDVKAIRLRVAEGNSQRAVAHVFGVSPSSVSYIVNRKSWAWLK